jgi:hypothetical protein
VHNIRSALDIMVCDMVIADGGVITNKTQLRTAKDRASYESSNFSLSGSLAALRPAARQFILEDLKPFKAGGNPLLMDLHRLDINDKHTSIITTIDVVQVLVPARLRRNNEALSVCVTFRSHQSPPDLREVAPDAEPDGIPRVSGIAVTFGYLGPFAQQGAVQVLEQLHRFTSDVLPQVESLYTT